MENLIHLNNFLSEINKEKGALFSKTIYITSIRTGLRHNELLGLRIKNIDIEFTGDMSG